MTERLSEITARIEGIRQLGAVVNAMRGIAGARAQQARGALAAVGTYVATLAFAISHTLALMPEAEGGQITHRKGGRILVLFAAEQGFVGAYGERLFDAAKADFADVELFLVGTRGAMLAAERGITPRWTGPLPSRPAGVPRFADHLAEALYTRIAGGGIDRLEVIFGGWRAERGLAVERRLLFPLNRATFPRPVISYPPLFDLPLTTLLDQLTADYIHAELCDVALHAFAAENQARMEAMASAHLEIERKLAALRSRQHVVRQEEITAEIIELAAGGTSGRPSLFDGAIIGVSQIPPDSGL